MPSYNDTEINKEEFESFISAESCYQIGVPIADRVNYHSNETDVIIAYKCFGGLNGKYHESYYIRTYK